MPETSDTPTIPVTGIKAGTIRIVDELHFTGGLRAGRSGDGWQISPLHRDGRIVAIRGIPERDLARAGAAMGLTLFGADEISGDDPDLPIRVWTPLFGLPRVAHQPSDTWGMIASASRALGDISYAKLSRSLAVSLRAAGLQIRNASDEYNKQLSAALRRGQSVGTRFTNLPLLELHLAFHSVVAEMASARDYIAQVSARRVKAPDRIDALNRLKDWVEKPANVATRNDPLIARLLDASNSEQADPWLSDLTEYRNLFLHREHIGAMAKWLMIEERDTNVGSVRSIMLSINTRPDAETTCDALTRFVDLYGRLCRLADLAASLAPYPPTPLHFVSTS